MPLGKSSSHGEGNDNRARGAPRRSKSNIDTGEVFQALAAGVLEYSRQKYLSKQQQSSSFSSSRSSHKSNKSNSSRAKGDEGTKHRGPVKRSGSSSGGAAGAAALMSLVVGVGAPLVKGIMERRKRAKDEAREEVAAAKAKKREIGGRGGSRSASAGIGSGIDVDAGLRSLFREAEQVSSSIRRVAGKKPPHPNCDVHAELVRHAERIEGSLDYLRTGANNVRNLGEDQFRSRRRSEGGEKQERQRSRLREGVLFGAVEGCVRR
jgi:hypothetical protein